MAYTDMPLPKFQKRFSTEEACLQAVFEARWPKGFICPRCGHNDGKRLGMRRSVQCYSCRRQTSITSQTIFHASHIPLTLWFLAIYLVAHDKGGTSAMKLAGQLGMHYATAWYLLHRIRFAMGTRDENLTLAGYIELDEAFFGGKGRNKRTRKGPKLPAEKKKQVLILVESEGCAAGNLVMRVVPNATWPTVESVVRNKVDADPPGHWFRSDGWQAHEAVMFLGHRIKMGHIPQSQQDAELPCMSLAITHVKRFLLGTCHQFCKRHLQRYLDEFCYRWNRRHLVAGLASHLIHACSLSGRTSYQALIAS